MTQPFHAHHSRGPVVAIEDVTLSSWVRHPMEGRTVMDHTFRVHWVRESSSTMRLIHGGHEIDSRFSTYIDRAAFDSFESGIEDFLRFSQRHQVGPQSTLRAEVITEITDNPLLAIDDPIVARLYNAESVRLCLKDLDGYRASGPEIYAAITNTWGIETPSEFAGEPGYRSHVVRPLRARAVAERVVWHSGMSCEPDTAALRAALAAEFGMLAREVA